MEFFFAENGKVKDISKVPEQFRGLYRQDGEEHVLDEGFKGVTTAIDGLNRSLKAARKDVEAAKKDRPDIAPWLGLGQLVGVEGEVDFDKVKAGIEGLLDKAAKGDAGKVNWDKMRSQLEDAHKKALEGKDGELRKMESTLVEYLVTSEATRAIAAHKGVPELLLPQISRQTKVVKDGEKFVVRVVDEAGDPRGNTSGGFMGIEDLVKELKSSAVFGRAFESESPQGGGKPPNSSTTRVPQGQNLSANDKIARGLAAGLAGRGK